jgi:putative hemolysin
MLYLELAIVAVLIVINGFLVMAELAVVSSRPARLKALADRGAHGARRALALAQDPGTFLSTVQVGITLISVASGAYSGATLGQRFADFLKLKGMEESLADPLGVSIVVALITYFTLIAGELVPKQVALRNPEKIALLVSPAMTWLAKLASPIGSVLNVSSSLLLRFLGHHKQTGSRVTSEEIRTLVTEAESAGVIEEAERDMIAGVMRLGDRPVRAVMTPRRDVDMIDLSAPEDEIRDAIMSSIHSRLPVHEGNVDELLGVIQAKSILDAYLRGEKPDLRAHIRKAEIVPDTADALDVVQVIKNSAVHIALIHDEYGHFEGVVTNADILEAIVGAFRTDEGAADEGAVQRDDGSWLLSGDMPADEMAEMLALSLPEDYSYQTAAGFALSEFGHLPKVGESFTTMGWRFEVVDLDGRRIDKLLASKFATRRPVV